MDWNLVSFCQPEPDAVVRKVEYDMEVSEQAGSEVLVFTNFHRDVDKNRIGQNKSPNNVLFSSRVNVAQNIADLCWMLYT